MAEFIKPTIYLIKDSVTDPFQIFKEAVQGTIRHEGEHNALFFYQPSHKNDPAWLGFVTKHYRVDKHFFYNASSYGVIVLSLEERLFVIPLGMGSHLIDMSKIEYNFGLRVAINCIPKDELRQLDLTTPESNSQKTKKQAVKGTTPEDFGVNKQKDILRGLVGKLPKEKIEGQRRPRPHLLGESIEGKDSVRISAKAETLDELIIMCRTVYRYYNDDKYKDSFPWIDNMAIVTDPPIVQELYDDLITAIQQGDLDNMYIAPPKFIDNLYEYPGFIFQGDKKRNKEPRPFPTIYHFIDDFGDEFITKLNKDILTKTCKFSLVNEDGKVGDYSWPLSKCIQWEIKKGDTRWVLSDGTWYKINEDFHKQVENFFQEAFAVDIGLLDMQGNLNREADYNAYISNQLEGVVLFDLGHPRAKEKSICKDKNEICDLYDVNRKRFIHVKSGKSSDAISHLLRQGAFSAYTLKRISDERDKFKGYLLEDGFAAAISEPYDASQYTVDFVLILGENQERDIPFFSKVSFMDVAQNLKDIGYKVSFSYVTKRAAITGQNNLGVAV